MQIRFMPERGTIDVILYCDGCDHCKRVNYKFKKSYDLPLDLLQYRRENSEEYLHS